MSSLALICEDKSLFQLILISLEFSRIMEQEFRNIKHTFLLYIKLYGNYTIRIRVLTKQIYPSLFRVILTFNNVNIIKSSSMIFSYIYTKANFKDHLIISLKISISPYNWNKITSKIYGQFYFLLIWFPNLSWPVEYYAIRSHIGRSSLRGLLVLRSSYISQNIWNMT